MNVPPKCTQEPVAIAIYAKAPQPGAVKTRLIPRLGAAGAASLQADLIARTVALAVTAQTGPVSLWCAPDTAHPLFNNLAERFGLALYRQCGDDLGARMADTFETLTRDMPVLLVGTDCAVLQAGHLSACAADLRKGNDAVFLPVEDGGYVLVGLREPAPGLFADIAWSTADVMAQTRQRAKAHGLQISEGTILWDVDRPEDVDRALAQGLIAL